MNQELKHNIKETIKTKTSSSAEAPKEDIRDTLSKLSPEQLAELKEQILKMEAPKAGEEKKEEISEDKEPAERNRESTGRIKRNGAANEQIRQRNRTKKRIRRPSEGNHSCSEETFYHTGRSLPEKLRLILEDLGHNLLSESGQLHVSQIRYPAKEIL